ncbi:MAG: TIGR02996 domain-containing protein [Myxococcaceae bacterium]|nr:TIGR02996 domain-containing protein [Myxococcaceae bacterium]
MAEDLNPEWLVSLGTAQLAEDWATCVPLLREKGFETTADGLKALARLLDKANGRRTVRVLGFPQVFSTAHEAATSRWGFSYGYGGVVDDERERCTVCLVFRRGEAVVLGIGESRAREPHPGRVWSELMPWSPHAPDNLPRVLVWASSTAPDRLRFKYSPPAPPTGRSEGGAGRLVNAILKSPEDDTPRLVYADWLTERNDPRGELISVQCALAQLPEDDASGAALKEREKTLLATHLSAWKESLGPGVIELHFQRGFVERVVIDPAVFLRQTSRLFEHEPVRHLVAPALRAQDVSALAHAPWLSQLKSLELSAHPYVAPLTPEAFSRLLESRGLRGLERLSVQQHPISDLGLMVLSRQAPGVLPSLKELELIEADITAIGVEALATVRWFGQLKRLELKRNNLRSVGVEALAFASMRGELVHLGLDANLISDDGAMILGQAPRLATLKSLDVQRNHIGPRGAKTLLDSPYLKALDVLQLNGNRMGEAAMKMWVDRFRLAPQVGTPNIES